MEITFKKPSLEVGFEAQKVYPALEPLTVTPSEKKQAFNHPNSYGYDEVIVNEVQGEELSVTPTTEEQINEGVYTKVIINPVTADIDDDIKPEYIKKGRNILGVDGDYEGIDTSDATATEKDILAGKTAYANNEKITGTATLAN